MRKRASHTARLRALLPAIACLALAVAAPAAAQNAAQTGSARGHVSAAPSFRARIRGALGLVPPANRLGQLSTGDVATGALTPETYHGGPVMTGGVTIHTIFWAP